MKRAEYLRVRRAELGSHIYPEIHRDSKDKELLIWPDSCPVCGAKKKKNAKPEQRFSGHVYKCKGQYTSKPQIQTHTDKWWGVCPIQQERVRLKHGKACEGCKSKRLEGAGLPETFSWDCRKCGHHHLGTAELAKVEEKKRQEERDRLANKRLADVARKVNSEQEKEKEEEKAMKKKVIAKKVAVKKETAKKAAKESTTRVVGKTYGLGVEKTWVKLFTDNAKAKVSDRMSDEAISKFMYDEFPSKHSAVFAKVQAVRGKYNRGGFNGGVAPAVQSQRYNEEGEVTTARGVVPKKEKSTPPVAKKTVAKKTVVKKAVVKKVVAKKD